MSYHQSCDVCGISLEIDFDDEDGTVCAQCKANMKHGTESHSDNCHDTQSTRRVS